MANSSKLPVIQTVILLDREQNQQAYHLPVMVATRHGVMGRLSGLLSVRSEDIAYGLG